MRCVTKATSQAFAMEIWMIHVFRPFDAIFTTYWIGFCAFMVYYRTCIQQQHLV